jgi:hypothetical protein
LLLSEVPKVTQRLLARIPRLENVAAILAYAARAQDAKIPASAEAAKNAAVLLNVLEFDALMSRGESARTAIATLRARWGAKYAPLLAHLAALHDTVDSGTQLREIRLCDVVPGMILMDELRTDRGTLLVSSGYEVSQSFVDRMRNFGSELLAERVRVRITRTAAEAKE